MIVFTTSLWSWDITNKGLTFNESSEFFSSEQSKSFSFPISVTINEDTANKLGLINIEGIYYYKTKIYGTLKISSNFYDAYLSINSAVGDTANITFFYGKEVLGVFDKELKNLNFPVIDSPLGLPAKAKSLLDLQWPNTTHQFVKILRDELKTKTNYKYFENFLNNYNTVTEEFPVNSSETITNENEDLEVVAFNRNLMVPMPYLIEMLRVLFASEGLEIRGDFVNDVFNHKIVYVPKNYFERFSTTQYLAYSFGEYSFQETLNGQTINVYQKTHTPVNIGSFSLKMKVNMSNAMAQFFQLKVTQNGNILYLANSINTQVNINETLNINILNNTVFFDIEVELKLAQQTDSIVNFNSFVYEYKEGSINVFPEKYTLADFMPDMKCREFLNKVREWFNLKLDYTDNAVYINYLEKHLETITFEDKSHLQQVDTKREFNKNNLFKLKYANGEEVMVNRLGQTFSDDDYTSDETEIIDIEALPLEVRENYGTVTAVYPKEEKDLMFVLYDGKQFGDNVAVNLINNRSLKLIDIYSKHFKNWLKFRSNSESYSDSFVMHHTETLNIREGIFKYNKQHLMVSIRKKRINEQYWQVDVEAESL
ncbi:hypothetical protein [Lacinutrix sp. Hel_I_90]|uniref:hypothetical protein n=1 Tax=Lacinutrix sp. Hel_I_90 TaxID=1249999 RepID=UPI0005C82BB3|nr:hypothetical protein [Lacinutrix sp. Hel_I_90]